MTKPYDPPRTLCAVTTDDIIKTFFIIINLAMLLMIPLWFYDTARSRKPLVNGVPYYMQPANKGKW